MIGFLSRAATAPHAAAAESPGLRPLNIGLALLGVGGFPRRSAVSRLPRQAAKAGLSVTGSQKLDRVALTRRLPRSMGSLLCPAKQWVQHGASLAAQRHAALARVSIHQADAWRIRRPFSSRRPVADICLLRTSAYRGHLPTVAALPSEDEHSSSSRAGRERGTVPLGVGLAGGAARPAVSASASAAGRAGTRGLEQPSSSGDRSNGSSGESSSSSGTIASSSTTNGSGAGRSSTSREAMAESLQQLKANMVALQAQASGSLASADAARVDHPPEIGLIKQLVQSGLEGNGSSPTAAPHRAAVEPPLPQVPTSASAAAAGVSTSYSPTLEIPYPKEQGEIQDSWKSLMRWSRWFRWARGCGRRAARQEVQVHVPSLLGQAAWGGVPRYWELGWDVRSPRTATCQLATRLPASCLPACLCLPAC